ncbi:hypothetical protein [Quatrionicoccus australiensis]|uniref:hypothetical protein n=1 Tax=Quatrionicoccus australiensis TaxID=138118 RepID=UPI001CF9AFF3|nr:hypothetical protein [Quatrionicoccus australiensis]MCB4359788.1 hypothetical protein [Quatrionicoccus australiensis]
MKTNHSEQSVVASAADRFFRAYEAHCVAPDVDTLFNLLNALHSLNDKLKKTCNADLFDLKEFVALKALRNLFHHEEELRSEIRVVASRDLPPILTDLLFLCLVPSGLVEKSIRGIEKKRKTQDEPLVRNALKWYGNVVNINPCIFNCAVHVFQKIRSIGIELHSDAYIDFRESYEFEENEGHDHFITGDIACHAGSVEHVLQTVFADVV